MTQRDVISTQQPTLSNSPTILSPDVTFYLHASLSENSRKAYRSDLNHFLTWGGTIPASPEMVAV